MRVVESLVVSKSGHPEDCQDALFFNQDFAAVVDGVTSRPGQGRWRGMEGGRAAALLICEALAHLPAPWDARGAVDYLTERVADLYRREDRYREAREDPGKRVAASLAVFSRHRREIWRVGDCPCLVGHTYFPGTKKVDELLAGVRALYLEAELLQGKTREQLMERDTGREFLGPLLARQSLFQNFPQGKGGGGLAYGVIDGFPVSPDFIQVIALEEGTPFIVLATDGYPYLESTLGKSEGALARILARDPLLIREFQSTKGLYPGQVSFDDRAYLKIGLDPPGE